jgi:hypothetical protein
MKSHPAQETTVIPLPQPELLGCYSDLGFTPPLAAMQLRWPGEAGNCVLNWTLPGGEVLHGAPPKRFAVLVRRQAEDAYALTLVWDSTCRQWFSLRRHEITASGLSPVLAALGTRLDSLLDQPIGAPDRSLPDSRLTAVRASRRVE